MAKKRKYRISAGLIFGWLGLLVAVGFFWLRADESGDQQVELFLRNQIHVESSVKAVRNQSQLLKAAMKESIADDTTEINAGLADTLELISQHTDAILGLLNTHLSKLDSMAGRLPDSHTYQKAGEKGPNLVYWESHRGRLEQALADYGTHIQEMCRAEGQEIDLEFSHWEDLPLEGSYAANIALLHGVKLEALQAERGLLDVYNQRLGVSDYQADRLIPWAMPKSNVGLVGIPYEIRLGFLTTTDAIQPNFSSQSGSIRTDEGSPTATLTIVPEAEVIPFGKKEGIQRYAANIQVPKVGGGYEWMEIEEEIVVRSPTATIQPRKGQFFYRYCANDIRIDVPDLGEMNNLSISATQAQVIPSKSDPSLFRIYPVGNETEVRISSIYNGKKTLISSVPVQVISPPKPEIQLLVNGEVHEGEVPVSRESEVAIRLVPNQEFQVLYGEDAKYGIGSVEVRVQGKGAQQILKVIEGTADAFEDPLLIPLADDKYLSKRGDQVTPVILRISGIFQRNFTGKRVPDTEFSAQERTRILFVR